MDCLPAARPVMIAVIDTKVFVAIEGIAEREAAERGDVLALQIDGSERSGLDLWWVEITGPAKRSAWDPETMMLLRGSPISSARTRDSEIMILPVDHIRGEQTTLTVPGAPS
ncbi:MAG: hypothetical protein WCI12_01075 [Actinomycetes bacterium]